ncbi:MAG TPA: hypothetical protein EYQ00_12355 [Dehalococcoidia bacterium]|jgi:hypothetical protein|nr:hypothetical protein [Dehalococcoidia bacterium]
MLTELLEDGDLVECWYADNERSTMGIVIGIEDFAYTILLANGELETIHVMDLKKIIDPDS